MFVSRCLKLVGFFETLQTLAKGLLQRLLGIQKCLLASQFSSFFLHYIGFANSQNKHGSSRILGSVRFRGFECWNFQILFWFFAHEQAQHFYEECGWMDAPSIDASLSLSGKSSFFKIADLHNARIHVLIHEKCAPPLLPELHPQRNSSRGRFHILSFTFVLLFFRVKKLNHQKRITISGTFTHSPKKILWLKQDLILCLAAKIGVI